MPSSSSSSSAAAVAWCSDALHDLLGFADGALASYLVSVAKESGNADAVLAVLREGGVAGKASASDDDDDHDGRVRTFCRELVSRVGGSRKGGGSSKKKKPAASHGDYVRAAAGYELLDDNDDDDDDESDGKDDAHREKKAKKKKKDKSSKKKSKEKDEKDGRGRKDRGREERSRDDDEDDDRRDRKKRRRYRGGGDGGNSSGGSEDEDDDEGRREMDAERRRRGAEERRERRRRQKEEGDGGDGDGDVPVKREGEGGAEEGAVKKEGEGADGAKEEDLSHLTAEERAELERERDLRERDEFVRRMLEKDKSKTKQKAGIKTEDGGEGDGEDAEAARQRRLRTEERLARGEKVVDEATGQEMSLERLREESRRQYLKKREEREVALLKQSLEDEEELFKGQKLTDAEKRRVEIGRQILSMVEGKESAGDKDADKNDGFYRLPDEYEDGESKVKRDHAALTARYVEEKHEKSEQELWEESQTHKAAAIGGAGKKKKPTKADEYELVFDDQIDFVMQETSKGYDKRDRKHRVKQEEGAKEEELLKQDPLEPRPATAHEKILAGRKKLPVFPYREEFLAAVKDHQVLILVGETGSGYVVA